MDEWMNGGYPDVTTSTLPTAEPTSQLDVSAGGLWDSATGSISKLLDAYTAIETVKYSGAALPVAGVPVGYIRTSSGQMVPAGSVQQPSGGLSQTAMIMLAVAGVALFVMLGRKG